MVVHPQLHFDVAIFADTQEEPGAVYRHLEWLKSIAQPAPERIPGELHVLNLGAGVQSTTLYLLSNRPPILVATAGKLGDDLRVGRNTTGGRFASIPAFTTADGRETVGRTPRQCSKEYKTEVIERTIRREVLGLAPRCRVPKSLHIHSYMGISLDEAGRAGRIMNLFREKVRWITPHFPLLDMFWTRPDCLTYLAGKVPHQTPRSACVFCPYHSDVEWYLLKTTDPEGWARAVEVDEALRTTGTVANRDMNQVMYLHRSCKPLVQIQFDTRPKPRDLQLSMSFAEVCEGVCGV